MIILLPCQSRSRTFSDRFDDAVAIVVTQVVVVEEKNQEMWNSY